VVPTIADDIAVIAAAARIDRGDPDVDVVLAIQGIIRGSEEAAPVFDQLGPELRSSRVFDIGLHARDPVATAGIAFDLLAELEARRPELRLSVVRSTHEVDGAGATRFLPRVSVHGYHLVERFVIRQITSPTTC
jgi:hypothetical protein